MEKKSEIEVYLWLEGEHSEQQKNNFKIDENQDLPKTGFLGEQRDDHEQKSNEEERRSNLSITRGDSLEERIIDYDTSNLRLPKLVIGILLCSTLLMAMAVSVLAPFYPGEANERGVSASQYGFVFGVFDLVTCVCSIPVGNMASRFGPRLFFLFGVFMETVSALVFCTIVFTSNGAVFLAISFICRIIGGVGKVFINVGMLTLIPLLFPSNASTLISWGESLYGAGFIVAPAIGGLLYELAGFAIPFLIIGALLCGLLCLAVFFIPKTRFQRDEVSQNKHLFLAMLKIPRVWICLLSGAIVPGYVAFLSATFEPSIRFLNLSSSQVGLIFAVSAVTYMASTVVCGWMCDKQKNPIYLMMFGSVVTGMGIVLIGLSTTFEDYILYLNIPGLAVMGSGAGGLFVPTLVYMKRVCVSNGFPEDIKTHGVISGFFVASISLGGVLGPTVGGVLYDSIGFTNTNAIFLGFYALSAVLIACLIFTSACGKDKLKNDLVL